MIHVDGREAISELSRYFFSRGFFSRSRTSFPTPETGRILLREREKSLKVFGIQRKFPETIDYEEGGGS